MPHAIIQVPAYRENLTPTLDAIAQQQILTLDNWTVDREVWVTPTGPDCRTLQQARQHPDFTAFEAPQGKLSTRNQAHDAALDKGADAIVTWDADAKPAHNLVLQELLEPLSDPSTVAVNSNPKATGGRVMDSMVNTMLAASRTVLGHMHGQAHSMTAPAWNQAGPFNQDVDETQVTQVWTEEEFRFYRRLRNLGKVKTARNAVVENDTRRWECRLTAPFNRFTDYPGHEGYCERKGVETFDRRNR